MVLLWSALVFGCLIMARLRHVATPGVTSVGQSGVGQSGVGQSGVDWSVVGLRPPAGSSVRARTNGVQIYTETRFGVAAVTTLFRTLTNPARGPSRDPSPA
jgi:hypothetical protein